MKRTIVNKKKRNIVKILGLEKNVGGASEGVGTMLQLHPLHGYAYESFSQFEIV